MTNNDSEKAEVLGKFFSSVYTIGPEWTWVLNDEDKPNISKVINIEITQELIQKELCKLNVNKSPGPDNLHPRVVKELADVLVKPLHIIFNLSLRLGKIPPAWKTATVSASYKLKGSKNVAENYRPISLTNIMSRIMISIIRDSMMGYLKSNSILSDKQFGFMGQKSTILQLLKIVDEWTKILDSGGFIDVVYCDFQKAFDTVPHNRLLDLLTHYGINEPIFSWISDFLSNRKQQVSINGCLSSTFCVTSGVPQGSVLGPLLFIIFINSLVEKATTDNMYLYADDLKVFNEICSDEDVDKLQYDIDKLYDWTQYYLLKFHPDKCVVMRLIPSKGRMLHVSMCYGMDDVKLKVVDKEKDLGIIFDNTLSFEEHITSKVNKANSLVGMLRRSFVYMDKDMFKTLFVSIVRPHIEYGEAM